MQTKRSDFRLDLQKICTGIYGPANSTFYRANIASHIVHQRWKAWRRQGQQLCTTSVQEDFIMSELKREDLVFFQETHLLDGEKWMVWVISFQIDLFLNGGKLTLGEESKKQVSGKSQLASGITQLFEHRRQGARSPRKVIPCNEYLPFPLRTDSQKSIHWHVFPVYFWHPKPNQSSLLKNLIVIRS